MEQIAYPRTQGNAPKVHFMYLSFCPPKGGWFSLPLRLALNLTAVEGSAGILHALAMQANLAQVLARVNNKHSKYVREFSAAEFSMQVY